MDFFTLIARFLGHPLYPHSSYFIRNEICAFIPHVEPIVMAVILVLDDICSTLSTNGQTFTLKGFGECLDQRTYSWEILHQQVKVWPHKPLTLYLHSEIIMTGDTSWIENFCSKMEQHGPNKRRLWVVSPLINIYADVFFPPEILNREFGTNNMYPEIFSKYFSLFIEDLKCVFANHYHTFFADLYRNSHLCIDDKARELLNSLSFQKNGKNFEFYLRAVGSRHTMIIEHDYEHVRKFEKMAKQILLIFQDFDVVEGPRVKSTNQKVDNELIDTWSEHLLWYSLFLTVEMRATLTEQNKSALKKIGFKGQRSKFKKTLMHTCHPEFRITFIVKI